MEVDHQHLPHQCLLTDIQSLESLPDPTQQNVNNMNNIIIRTYVHTYMCHGVGTKVEWIKEYHRLTYVHARCSPSTLV